MGHCGKSGVYCHCSWTRDITLASTEITRKKSRSDGGRRNCHESEEAITEKNDCEMEVFTNQKVTPRDYCGVRLQSAQTEELTMKGSLGTYLAKNSQRDLQQCKIRHSDKEKFLIPVSITRLQTKQKERSRTWQSLTAEKQYC